MKIFKNKRKQFTGYVNRLGVKLTLLTLIIIAAADVLSFTATIIIDMIAGGTTQTTDIIASVIASIVIGALLSFVAGNTVVKPLSELTKATKRVTNGDYSAKLEIGWSEKHTVKELSDLINDFNEMTEELQSTEMFRSDFIAAFSHEFKTPLQSIRGFARQLYEGELTREQQKEFSKIILDETEYLSVLSQNTLLMTNLENKDIITEKTEFSLDEQLRDCMIRLEPQWSEKNIEIDMDLQEVNVFWNEQLLAHVWGNLFDNAVKFTSKGGKIQVSCKKENGRIIVSVADNGCGIPADKINHIFDKFYQADSSHAARGNGLGLPLAKRIIELFGGTIETSSEPGKGTTFTVTLFTDNKGNVR